MFMTCVLTQHLCMYMCMYVCADLKRYMKDVCPLPVLNLERMGRIKQFVYSERREQSILIVSIVDLCVILSGYYGEPVELWWAINGFHTVCVILYAIEATVRLLTMHKKEVFSERYDIVDISCVVILLIALIAEWILFVCSIQSSSSSAHSP
jgi:hypothetical protein